MQQTLPEDDGDDDDGDDRPEAPGPSGLGPAPGAGGPGGNGRGGIKRPKRMRAAGDTQSTVRRSQRTSTRDSSGLGHGHGQGGKGNGTQKRAPREGKFEARLPGKTNNRAPARANFYFDRRRTNSEL